MPPFAAPARAALATLRSCFADVTVLAGLDEWGAECLPSSVDPTTPAGALQTALEAHWTRQFGNLATLDPTTIARVAGALAAEMVATSRRRPSRARDAWVRAGVTILRRHQHRTTAALQAVLDAAPREVRTAFWQRTPPVAAWFRTPGARRPARRPHLQQIAMLLAALRAGTLTGTDIHAACRRWGNLQDTMQHLCGAWTEDWQLFDDGPPAVPAHDPWVRFVQGALTASAGPSPADLAYHQTWRKEILHQLKLAEECLPRGGVATDLLDTHVRIGPDVDAPLTIEALDAFTWASEENELPPAAAEVARLIARLPDLPNAPTSDGLAPPVVQTTDAVTAFLKGVLRHPSIAWTAVRALWARYPARATRMLLLADCDLINAGGPWCHDRAFVDDVFSLLAEFRQINTTVDERELLTAYVGFVSADLWLHLLATSDAALLTGDDVDPDRTSLTAYLQSLEQFPDWRPSVEGLTPLLLHRNRVVREWAQFALATATERPAEARAALPDIGFTAGRAARRR